ncbi:50S ribosomal protein L21 [Candidatus Jorgensenbacteria bacterium]|nr:50S ribosomal protein L21 [Candidatus Jorgensenbacteria bacterium]
MFAIISTGGKQYKVVEGGKIKIEKLDSQEGESVVFDHVLLIADGEKATIGEPYLKNVKVEGKVLKQGRDGRKIVFRYHSKTRYRKKKTHRQPFTEVEITKIS